MYHTDAISPDKPDIAVTSRSFVRQLEEKERSEVWPVRLDVAAEIVFRPNLPNASKSAGHRHDSRQKVQDAGSTEERRK